MKPIFLALILSVLTVTCGKNDTPASCPDPHLDCTGINCIIHNYYFSFRIVDKTTGADLVFGNTPRYTVGDVALYMDQAHTQPIVITADNAQRLFETNLATPDMYLVIAGTISYKITATYKALDCCASRVKNLDVNGLSLCTCCADGIEIPVN